MITKVFADRLKRPALLTCFLCLSVLTACVSDEIAAPDASVKGTIGSPCATNDECESQLCLESICQSTEDQTDPGDVLNTDAGPADAGPGAAWSVGT